MLDRVYAEIERGTYDSVIYNATSGKYDSDGAFLWFYLKLKISTFRTVNTSADGAGIADNMGSQWFPISKPVHLQKLSREIDCINILEQRNIG